MNRRAFSALGMACTFGLATAAALGAARSTPERQGPPTPSPPRLIFAMELRVKVSTPVELGQVPRGRRRVIAIEGGTFEGPSLKGTVLPGGADWQIVRADGLAELDARYLLRTDAGELVYIQNAGMRHAAPDITQKLLAGQAVDPSLVYFRTVPTFETSAPGLQWLTRAIFIGTGERHPNDVVIRVWRAE